MRPTGSKLWRYRYRLHGKENVFALGEYPELSLADARKARDDARKLVKQGTNPAHSRKLDRLTAADASRDTFEAVALEWSASRAVECKWSDSCRKGVQRILDADLLPALGKLPMRQIKAAHLLAALRDIEKRGARTVAAKARFLSSEIWRYAVATLRADSDLAASLRGAVRMPDHKHHPSLTRDEIPAFLAAFGNYSGRKETATAIKLLLLLFPRPGELLGASWAEFDLDAALWRIPAERMKMGEEHLIPLPSQAVELLRGLKFLTGKYPHLFPHRDQRHKPMTDSAFRQALRSLGYSRKLTNVSLAIGVLAEALSLTVRARVCRALLNLTKALAEAGITQEQLAKTRGLARSTVRNQWAGLKARGALEMSYGKMQVPNSPLLESYRDEQ